MVLSKNGYECNVKQAGSDSFHSFFYSLSLITFLYRIRYIPSDICMHLCICISLFMYVCHRTVILILVPRVSTSELICSTRLFATLCIVCVTICYFYMIVIQCLLQPNPEATWQHSCVEKRSVASFFW